MTDFLEDAEAAEQRVPSKGGRKPVIPYGALEKLRAKGWTWEAIRGWLDERKIRTSSARTLSSGYARWRKRTGRRP